MINIYKITNLITNESYIGQTHKSIEQRFQQHVVSNDCNKLHEAILDYGRLNFSVELLFQCETKEEANRKESECIIKYNTIEHGYNKILSDYQVAQENNAHYFCEQKPLVDELKNTLSISKQFISFETLNQAIEYFVQNKEKILLDIDFSRKRGAGMAKYTSEQIDNMNLISVINKYLKPNGRRGIYQYDTDLKLIAYFNSPMEAARELNLNKDLKNTSSFISEVARGRKRLGYGYIWSYLDLTTLNIFIKILSN